MGRPLDRRTARFATAMLIVAAAFGAGRDARAQRPGKKYALLVGVDRYGKGTLLPGLGDSPRRDVEGMAAALVEAGFARDDIVVMTLKAGAEDPDLLPNADAIRNQLDLMLKPLRPADTVVVMLVGHGVMMDAPSPGGGKPVAKSFFCAMDANLARRGDLSRFLALDEVFDALKGCEATTKLLLVDACRNELKAAPPEARAAGIAMPKPPPPPPSVAALYSCSEKEVSWQDSALGGGHGVFSHFLIEGLKGAADAENGNRDGAVTLDELTGYVRDNVFRFVRTRHAASQMPRLFGDIGFVVLRDRLTKPSTVRSAMPRVPDNAGEPSEKPSDPEFLTSRVSGIKLKRIPAGRFLMGSSKDEDNDAKDNELPRHEVRISRPFYLGVTEVTQGQYQAALGQKPDEFKSYPKGSVSWKDAIAFCNTLSEKEGVKPYYRFGGGEQSGGDGYRLPTEAEWEYACRAGSTTRYSFGDDAANLGDHAWFDNNSGGQMHPVGQKRPNAFGLFDMHGNVWEWCWDGYDEKYYATSPATDPSGPLQAADRVFRGGSWGNYIYAQDARSASRRGIAPHTRSGSLGFRLARDQAETR